MAVATWDQKYDVLWDSGSQYYIVFIDVKMPEKSIIYSFDCMSIPPYTGVAVATVFCAIKSLAVTSSSQWPFGVTDTGT